MFFRNVRMLRCVLLVSGMGVIVGCGGFRESPLSTAIPEVPATVSIDTDDDNPIVSVYINDHGPYRFLLDTGTPTVLLSERVAKELALPHTLRSIQQATAQGRQRRYATEVKKLQIGTAALHDIDVQLDSRPFPFDGIIGLLAFDQCQVRVDFPGKQLQLLNQRLECSHAVAITDPYRLVVDVTFEDEQGHQRTWPFHLATGRSISMAMGKDRWDQAFKIWPCGVRIDDDGTVMAEIRSVDATVTVGGLPLPPDIDLMLQKDPAPEDSNCGILGFKALSNYIITFDLRSKQLTIE